MYVNLVNWFKISQLIIPCHHLHRSPASTWTWSIVFRSLIWSSHPILFICLQRVRELGQLFYDLSSDHPLHPSPARTWTWSTVLWSLIWSSHPILFIRLQFVRELGQLFYDLSSDHPIPSSSSISREYVNLVNCFVISHLIIFFIRLQLVRERGQLFYDLSSDHPIPSSSSVSREYVNLVNCFMISHLIILSHPLHPSPGCTWTWSTVLWSLIWSSHPILFIRLQEVRELGQLFYDLSSDHTIPSSSSISR